MDVQEPNPGRVAKRDEQRRQRRSIFMTALIGSTVTAILAAAAAFRIDDNSGASTVKIVTTTTKARNLPTTTDTAPDAPQPPLYEPPTLPPDHGATTTATTPVTDIPTTAPTTTTSTTTPVGPPPPTSPPPTGPPGRAHIVWHLTPGSVTVQSGAQTSISLTATNDGTATGSVEVPPCPAAPHRYSVTRPGHAAVSALDNACHPGTQVLLIRPGQTLHWTDTVSATTDATRYGAALAPGNYLVLVNGDLSPLMFLVMHVSS